MRAVVGCMIGNTYSGCGRVQHAASGPAGCSRSGLFMFTAGLRSAAGSPNVVYVT